MVVSCRHSWDITDFSGVKLGGVNAKIWPMFGYPENHKFHGSSNSPDKYPG